MNVKSAKYISILGNDKAHIQAVIDDVNVTVPLDSNNRHYQAIQEWVAEGNKIEDAD